MMNHRLNAPFDSIDMPSGLRLARCWLAGVILGSIVLACLLAAHGALRTIPRERAATRWMRYLDLDMPALWPSGSGLRAPQSLAVSVIPRMTAGDVDMEMHTVVMQIRFQDTNERVAP